MKKIITLGFCLALGSSLLFMNSCKKLVDDASETSESTEDMASDLVALQTLTDAMQDIVSSDPNLQQKNGLPFISREHFRYLGDDSVFTDGDGIVMYIDFEDKNHPKYPYFGIGDPPPAGTGSLGGDGSTRWGSGKLTIRKPYSDPDCEIKFELDRYIVLKDGILYQLDDGTTKFGGTYEIVVSRTSPDTWELNYNLSFKKRKLTESDVSRKTYGAGTFQMTTIDGGSEGLLDDEITITGSAKDCKNSRGVLYTVDITETLRRVLEPGCSNTFVSGKFELKNEGSKFTVKADFGNGDCDNDVEVTLPGNVKKTITVK